jgi:glycosyltransferase involved in cell wall biosynthesis
VYLLPITVPIYVDGPRTLIATDWKRALGLLRDSHAGRYGHLCVAAPWRPASEAEQVLETATQGADGIELLPVFDQRDRLKTYWTGSHRQALARVKARLPEVKLVHGTSEEPLRPFCYAAFMAAARDDVPSVFVQDQDVVAVIRDFHRHDGLRRRAVAEVHARLHDAQCHRGVAAAGVSFLKGRTTIERYRGDSPHIHAIEDTSYFSWEIVDEAKVRERVESMLHTPRALRLAFCGRLVDLKGVDRSLNLVAQARREGARLEYEIYGSGPEEAALKRLAQQLGLDGVVRFHGALPYGAELLARLSQADALLFNPRMQETPRMIFDGYAAGLPLIADGIDYVQERARAESAACVLQRGDDADAVRALVELDRDRRRLAALTTKALAAAQHHAADRWYERRALWTAEMVERHWRGRTPPAARAPRPAG